MTSMATESGSSQLKVVVRIRPLNEEEKQLKAFQCVHALDSKRVLLVDPEKFENNILRQNRQFERQFTFDAAFGPRASQPEVHAVTTSPLVDFVISGYNATVFAYGPTGSGKTYTMVGTRESAGLMTLLTRELYDKINPRDFTVYISFLEIYNEVIRDLLNPSGAVLDLLENEKGAVQVTGLSRVKAPNTIRIMELLQSGNSRRTQEPTAANKNSSRSHALLQVTLYKHSAQHGKLFLIDLAGSERATNTQNTGQRLKEGAAINRSLLALGNVINALSSGSKDRFVNYRDSKLTRLLKDSLGGNSKTCMIAHVTPSDRNYDETYNTLTYANRAKNITNRLVRNRPASADQQYSGAIREMQTEAASRQPLMTHAVSSGQREDRIYQREYKTRSHVVSSVTQRNGDFLPTTRTSNYVQHPKVASRPPHTTQLPALNGNFTATSNNSTRKFSSLFNSLKDQYLAALEKQQKLWERLLKANHEAYEVEMNRNAKAAILDAWDSNAPDEGEKFSNIIERIKKESQDQEKRLTQLQETRQRIERALRKGVENMQSLETRMRSIAREEHNEVIVDLLVKMARRDAEKIATVSDSILQSIRLRRQHNSLLKVEKYEQIADKLISGDLPEGDREVLEREYRAIRNQLNYHLLPQRMENTANMISWNSLMLNTLTAALDGRTKKGTSSRWGT